jgi:hypothetical protein
MAMIRQQQARRARGLRGKAEAAGGKRRLDLDPGQRRDQRATFQPFFQSPGGIFGSARFDEKKKRGIEAIGDETGAIRAPPFPRHLVGEAPQHEITGVLLGRLLGNQGKGETERRRAITIGFGPDLMQPPAFEPAQGSHPLPGGRREGVRSKRAGRAVGRGRARCGGDGQRHGNLLERADFSA